MYITKLTQELGSEHKLLDVCCSSLLYSHYEGLLAIAIKVSPKRVNAKRLSTRING